MAAETSAGRDRGLQPPEVTFVGDYDIPIDNEGSFGARARDMWFDQLGEAATYSHDYAILYTGIGGAPGETAAAPITTFPQAIIPHYVDLQEHFGHVPKLLYLAAGPVNDSQLLAFSSLARTYREQGVKTVIALLTSIAHERQDREFFDEDGRSRRQAVTLKDAVELLALHCDAGILLQPHSLKSVEYALNIGMPLLPIDPFRLMMHKSGLENIENGLVLGPDKGRRNEAKMAASWFGWPMASANKHRDRKGGDDVTATISTGVKDYIRANRSVVLVYDDEVRSGETIGALADELSTCAEAMIVVTVKPVLVNKPGKKPAVEHLAHPLIHQVITTDAVLPVTSTDPIAHKLTTIPLKPELIQIVKWFEGHLVDRHDRQWLRNSRRTKTDLRLDLRVE